MSMYDNVIDITKITSTNFDQNKEKYCNSHIEKNNAHAATTIMKSLKLW